eukprot:TRINITY_DN8079_c0_g1_i1.p1 TRINITY_DN8079_c0_g1~~TRINITY_DN8079_c0_g1_i1.p1  ORF type:complete len:119 (-),score=17.12 TRINITY_DN8079_c0_g1_i1:107-463(-)
MAIIAAAVEDLSRKLRAALRSLPLCHACSAFSCTDTSRAAFFGSLGLSPSLCQANHRFESVSLSKFFLNSTFSDLSSDSGSRRGSVREMSTQIKKQSKKGLKQQRSSSPPTFANKVAL